MGKGSTGVEQNRKTEEDMVQEGDGSPGAEEDKYVSHEEEEQSNSDVNADSGDGMKVVYTLHEGETAKIPY